MKTATGKGCTGLAILIAICAALGCQTKRTARTAGQEGLSAVPSDTSGSLLQIRPGFVPDSLPTYTVKGFWIEGQRVFLDVSYSGGCKSHQWDLVFNGMIAKSLPPKATLFLVHHSNGDYCKKLLRDTLAFGLAPLRPYGRQIHVKPMGVEGYQLVDLE